MSAGAVFKLIANDGKADRLIMATKLLNQRINDVMCARKKAGKADITPTLVDLERTHILFINAHFKPFAAIGYEYNKVKPQSGNPVLGAEVTFSIPQFGDFFADMVCRVALSSVASSTQFTPTQSGSATGAPWPANKVATAWNIVDPLGNALTGGGSPNTFQNWVRYCEFPGNALFTNVKFEVNGNPLDQYGSVVSSFLEKFTVIPGKRDGYNRLVGQEQPREGSTGPALATVNASGQSAYSQTQFAAPGVLSMYPIPDDANTPSAFLASYLTGGTNSVYNDYTRQQLYYLDGPQTPKPTQPAFEIWNKLKFWFNEDVRLAIPSVSIPFGQRFITISLAPQASLVFEYPGIFLQQITAATSGSVTSQTTTYAPFIIPGTISSVSITNIELYVNNIFVNPEVHDIFIKRIGFTLIRVYRFQNTNVNVSTNQILMSQLKWPVEYIFLGLQPTWNTSSKNYFMWRDWHRMNKNMTAQVNAATVVTTATVATGSGSNTAYSSSMGQIDPNWYALPLQTVDFLTVTAHGINIFDNFSQVFFNSYMPDAYGGSSLVTPKDTGALFINFALFPRSYQPSGHINISRAREFYVQYLSSYVTSNTPANLLAVAVCINFLLVTDGSAVLRYAT